MTSNVDAYIAVPGRLNPVDEDHIIAGADTIWDDELGKRQSEVNQEINDSARQLDEKIDTAITGIREEFSGIADTVSSQVSTAVSEARSEFSEMVSNTQRQLNSTMESISSQIDQKVDATISQVNSVVEVISSFSQENKREISLSVSPNIVFKGVRTTVTLIARCGTSASSIQILNGSNVILEGDGMQLYGEDTVTTLDDMVYTAKFSYGDVSFTTKEIVKVVNPIYYGANIPSQSLSLVESPEGIYHIDVWDPDSHIIFNIPASMQIKSATMGSVEFPLEEPESITIEGEDYKSYRSSNTYKVGSMTIVLT